MQNINLQGNEEFSKLGSIDLIELAQSGQYLEYRDSLGLDRKVRFGLELEYEGVDRTEVTEYLAKQRFGWKSEEDKTLSSGGEAISPKLIDERKTWENLRMLCDYLKSKNADTSHNAGLHVHVGAHLLGENLDAWRRFAKLYTIYERILIRFGFGDKVNARKTFFLYARPVGLVLLRSISDLDNSTSLAASIKFYKQIYDIKRNALNLRSLEFLKGIVNFNTLEFRNFNSTTEETIIQNNVNAVCHMLLAASNDNLDEDFLNYKLKQLEKSSLTERAYIEECHLILLRDMSELVDLIFDNNQDKMYFMIQYIRNFETSLSPDVKMARELVKK